MDEIRKQVRGARRRLLWARFLTVAAWTLFAGLLMGAIALAIPKIWAFGPDGKTWAWSLHWAIGWTAGGLLLGLAVALLWTWRTARSELDAALEIDRRFALKERVSSAVALHDAQLETPAARALLEDASRRVARVDLNSQFALPVRWYWSMPLAPALIVFVLLTFVPDAIRPIEPAAAAANAEQQQIKKAAEDLKRKLAERRKEALEKDLPDANDLLLKIEQGLEKMESEKGPVDRKKAVVELNDLASELDARRQKLQSTEEMKKHLNRLNDGMKSGPADEMAKAMEQGDFQAAMDELQELKEQLEKEEMSPEDREKLADQLQEMEQKLQKLADAHEQTKQQLQEQIAQKQQSGDMEAVNQLQQQLDQLSMQDEKMDQLREMAEKLGNCSQSCRNGDCPQAGEQLSQMADQLQQLQSEMDELEMLDEAIRQISQCKNGMCNGQGGDSMGEDPTTRPGGQRLAGGGKGKNNEGPPGPGMGEGQGAGWRPEEENPTDSYESQVRSQPGAGEAVVTGEVGGPNAVGNVREQVKEAMETGGVSEADPLTGHRLPRDRRRQAQQYFDRFREGK